MNGTSPQPRRVNQRARTAMFAAAVASGALLLSACSGQTNGVEQGGSLGGTVTTDGSSTVAPFTDAASHLLRCRA